MWKNGTVACVLALVALVSIGCQSNGSMPPRQPLSADDTSVRQISIDQLPSDVLRTVHQHINRARIISAETMRWKGARAYALYVKSGNNVYTIRIRPDGYYLGMSLVVD